MVIWTRQGWIGFIFIVGCLLGGQWFFDWLLGEGTFEHHVWPKLAVLTACSILCWTVGRMLNRDLPGRVFEVPARNGTPPGNDPLSRGIRGHTLAFIRLEYAGIVAVPLYLFIALEDAGLF